MAAGPTLSWSAIFSVTLFSMIGISFPTLSFFVSLLYFHHCWLFPSWLFIFVKSHIHSPQKTRRQLSYMLWYLYKNWLTDVQWLITNRLCPDVLSILRNLGRELFFSQHFEDIILLCPGFYCCWWEILQQSNYYCFAVYFVKSTNTFWKKWLH